MPTTKTALPRIAPRAEWLDARKELLQAEKEETRQRDRVSEARRRLPMVEIEDYTFDGPSGKVSLRDLFGDRQQLLTYHFMFDPAWEEGCKSCSHLIDNSVGSIIHMAARDTAFAVVSRAPIGQIEPFRRRMGWNLKWVSSFRNRFNYDFNVTMDPDEPDYRYNFADAKTLLETKKIWCAKGELPGLSSFIRDGERLFHTNSTYQRGLDLFLNTYNFLDQTPLGRNEADAPGQSWIRHHDRYGLTTIAV